MIGRWSIAVCSLVTMASLGCDSKPQARAPESRVPQQEKSMISQEEAIRIARKAIEGKVNLSEGVRVEVVTQGDSYVVTFRRNNPPGTRGPDYDARVTMNARTGEVTELMGGS